MQKGRVVFEQPLSILQVTLQPQDPLTGLRQERDELQISHLDAFLFLALICRFRRAAPKVEKAKNSQ